MALNIKNPEVERLVDEVVAMTGESKTEAIRKALAERCSRLTYRVAAEDRHARLRRFLQSEVWPTVPDDQIGRRLTREEQDAILGPDPGDPATGAGS